MRHHRALALATTALAGVLALTEPANAAPLLALVGGFVSGLGAAGLGGFIAGSAIGSSAFITGFSAALSVAGFAATTVGRLLLSAGLSLAANLLFRPSGPRPESARLASNLAAGPRWLHMGFVRAGGQPHYANFDADGNFWIVTVHGDSELTAFTRYYLDNVPVTVDVDGWVTTEEFTRDDEPQFRIWRTTFSPSDPVPPRVAALDAAFAEWDIDHKLAGTTFTVMMIKAQKAEHRYLVYRWRGPLGLGEPAISILGTFDRCYDPRAAAGHDINDASTWEGTNNLALLWARLRTHPRGFRHGLGDMAWSEIATRADVCDEVVLDKNDAEHFRYHGGISIADTTPRGEAHVQILLACDGQIFHTDDGKQYLEVGRYIAPTLTLTETRDIITMASSAANDGESETDGVVVKYRDADAAYDLQPCAAWKNPDFYEDGREPRYIEIDVPVIFDHNHAVRLAKIIGTRSQAPLRLQPVVGVRGILLENVTTATLDYTGLEGVYEVATQLEEDASGQLFSAGLVPTSAARYVLAEGEEGDKPAVVEPSDYSAELDYADNIDVTAVVVNASGALTTRLEATFDAAPRIDWRYEFQYRKEGDTTFRPFYVIMDDQLAYSDTVEDGAVYELQTRTVTAGGTFNDWFDLPDVTVTAETTAPADLSSVTAAAAVAGGHASFTIVTTADEYLATIDVYKMAAGDPFDIDDTPVASLGASPGTTAGWVYGDATVVNTLSNPGFDTATVWGTSGGWTIGSGVATNPGGSGGSLSQNVAYTAGDYRVAFQVTAYTAGQVRPRLTGGATVTGTYVTGTGWHFETLTSDGSNTSFSISADTAFNGSLDNAWRYKETAASAAAGEYDFYFVPRNASRVPGNEYGPVSVVIV